MAAVLAFGTATSAAAAPPETMTWPDTPPPAPPPPRVASAPLPPESDAERMNRLLRSDSELGDQYRRGRGMIIGGSVSLGAAGVSLLTAGVFSLASQIEPPDPEDVTAAIVEENERQRDTAIGFAIASGVLVAIGIPLVAVGAVRRADAMHRAKRRVSLDAGPHGFGLRF